MAAGGSAYFQPTQIRRRDPEDVNRGLQVGQEVGKLLSGLAGAIKESQKNALANKLMNTEDAPRAALVSPGGQWQPTGGDSGGGSGSSTAGPTQDLGQLPPQQDTTFTNPATGNIEPLQGQSDPDAELAQAMAAARLQNGSNAPTVGSSIPGAGGSGPTPSDQDLLNAMNAPSPASSTSTPSPSTNGKVWVPNAPIDPSKVPTAGTAPHTGGVQEMDLQKEILAQRLQKANLNADQLKAQDAADERAGTGRFALDAATKRAQLANIQSEIAARNAKPTEKVDKNAPPTDIVNEPVTSQDQLNKFIDSNYGKGASASLINKVSDTSQNPDVNGTVSFNIGGSDNKPVSMPTQEAAHYIKQANVLRKQQHLPLLRVPGEDLNLGRTADNPYPAQSKVDALSRASGTWIKMPNGQVYKVP
jgi:hypothetical protein